MDDRPIEHRRGALLLSSDRARIDLDAALALLRRSHWGDGMQRAVLARAIENSLVFGLYDEGRLVGFGRAVTDLATYAYLTDITIAESHRDRGLGAWLVESIRAHPDLQRLRRVAQEILTGHSHREPSP